MASPGGSALLSSSASSSSSPRSPTAASNTAAHRHRRQRRRQTNSQSENHDSPFSPLNHPFQQPQHHLEPPAIPHQSGRLSAFYMTQNLSNTSIESSALLDHREQQYMRPRRASTFANPSGSSKMQLREGLGAGHMERPYTEGGGRQPLATPSTSRTSAFQRHKAMARRESQGSTDYGGQESDGESANDTTGLLGNPTRTSQKSNERSSLLSPPTHRSSIIDAGGNGMKIPASSMLRNYGSVNFPPSVPTSPSMNPLAPLMYLDGTHVNSEHGDRGPEREGRAGGEAVINIHHSHDQLLPSSSPPTPPEYGFGQRQPTFRAEEDVCFPIDECLSGEEGPMIPGRIGRRIMREWPDLGVLEEWSREEKEQRSEGIRAKKTAEPVYVGGRLRPNLRTWHREEEEAPYRFTYFNDEFQATIHSHTISELVQPGQTFKDLFKPEPRKVDEFSDVEEQPIPISSNSHFRNGASPPHHPNPEEVTRPTFWLDVLSPTDAEMKILSKAFGIHPLTAEDILMQEAREKVELFRSYYLVCYKSFEQDKNSEDYLEPVHMYVVVFREGILSFHFSLTPHPANVRRRIRQLKDYISVSADWISYALIDDITDAFAPLIQSIEDEVDDIDDAILRLHISSPSESTSIWSSPEKKSNSGHDGEGEQSGGDMLKRVGDCRKKVMGLYRLLGNKADVIKGFAKRCNEQWEVAPRSEIGLYLGDIQDHIVTMVANLNHYEKILSRSHSNYLAQINIKMNERQEQTADVLGRLTVLGTIVLPMNIITGLWGMNVLVPGQGVENLDWFWCITAGLFIFGFLCYIIAKRVYKIV